MGSCFRVELLMPKGSIRFVGFMLLLLLKGFGMLRSASTWARNDSMDVAVALEALLGNGTRVWPAVQTPETPRDPEQP